MYVDWVVNGILCESKICIWDKIFFGFFFKIINLCKDLFLVFFFEVYIFLV